MISFSEMGFSFRSMIERCAFLTSILRFLFVAVQIQKADDVFVFGFSLLIVGLDLFVPFCFLCENKERFCSKDKQCQGCIIQKKRSFCVDLMK